MYHLNSPTTSLLYMERLRHMVRGEGAHCDSVSIEGESMYS